MTNCMLQFLLPIVFLIYSQDYRPFLKWRLLHGNEARMLFSRLILVSNHQSIRVSVVDGLELVFKITITALSAVKAWLSFWKWPRMVLSTNRLGTRKIQNGGWTKFLQKIMDIFVDIFHSLPSLRLLFIDRKYDSTFEIDQQNFSERFYWSIYLFQCITAV